MQLRRSILLAVCIILFIYFEIHSCSRDEVTGPDGVTPVESIICDATDVYFRDLEFGSVTGSLGTCIVTTDGGKTWRGSVAAEALLNDIQFLDAAKGWVVGKDGAMCRTSDAGATWVTVTSLGFPADEDFFKLYFPNENLGYVLGYHGVYRTDNGGLDWKNYWLPIVPYRGAWDMSFVDENTGFLLGSRYTDPDPVIIYRTVNGAVTWSPVEGSKASALRTILAIHFVNGSTGWAGGGVITKTTDGGASWQTQLDPATVREFFFLSEVSGFAVGGKSIMRTTDGGAVWENVSPPDDRINDLRGIYFVDDENGWVVGRGKEEQIGGRFYRHSLILRTSDGGATWKVRDFLYDYTQFRSLEDGEGI